MDYWGVELVGGETPGVAEFVGPEFIVPGTDWPVVPMPPGEAVELLIEPVEVDDPRREERRLLEEPMRPDVDDELAPGVVDPIDPVPVDIEPAPMEPVPIDPEPVDMEPVPVPMVEEPGAPIVELPILEPGAMVPGFIEPPTEPIEPDMPVLPVDCPLAEPAAPGEAAPAV